MTPPKALKVYSAAQITRNALEAWAWSIMRGIAPKTTTKIGQLEVGEAPDLPTLGLEWGDVEEFDTTPLDEAVYADGRGVMHLHDEEAQMAFVWRGTTPEDADLYAHEFTTRAKLAAKKSNPEGKAVLHLPLRYDGVQRTAKLYLSFKVLPVNPDDILTRSLYTLRCPGSVVYPVMRVEDPGKGSGAMNITVVLNGREVSLNDLSL